MQPEHELFRPEETLRDYFAWLSPSSSRGGTVATNELAIFSASGIEEYALHKGSFKCAKIDN